MTVVLTLTLINIKVAQQALACMQEQLNDAVKADHSEETMRLYDMLDRVGRSARFEASSATLDY